MKNEIKRLEIYVGWTCNQKCTYCSEYVTMERLWNKRVSKYDILKILLKYKKLGYNHVTYLGGEPFIQEVFYNALLLGKKLGFTILVTTNCTTLHLEKQAKKFLPLIDELIISVEGISHLDQKAISRTKNVVYWDNVFDNINKYSLNGIFKANIIITQHNLRNLYKISKYLIGKGVLNISIGYPAILFNYYGKEFTLKYIAPSYEESIKYILPIIELFNYNKTYFRIVDIPFCFFPKYYSIDFFTRHTDDLDYGNRLKLKYNDKETVRGNNKKLKPRRRVLIKECSGCRYENSCMGIDNEYGKLYGLEGIKKVI